MSRPNVLVVSDAHVAAVIRSALPAACDNEVVAGADAALLVVARGHVDVVVSDEVVSDMRGLDLVDCVRARSPAMPVILLGGAGDVVMATEAGRRGVFDYVVKPIDPLTLTRSVERAVGLRAQRTSTSETVNANGATTIIGTSARFLATLAAVERVAQSTAPVLLVGETGTGKDLLAARVHALGPRRHRPFVVVNAAALPATLLDSELFGHSAGSFTGATRARRGLITEADGGTLFLDEIVDLPIELQGRLLRVMETGAVRAVGSDHERHVDVRFVAATQEPLAVAVAKDRFREDLFFRLNVLSVDVPPLRERREDIPALVDYFLARALARTPQSVVTEIAPAAYDRLVHAPWPGNVRELAATLERLVVFGRRARVEADGIGEANVVHGEIVTRSAPTEELLTLRELSLRHVELVLEKTGGDKAAAAKILGIDVSTLYRWKRRHGALS